MDPEVHKVMIFDGSNNILGVFFDSELTAILLNQ